MTCTEYKRWDEHLLLVTSFLGAARHRITSLLYGIYATCKTNSGLLHVRGIFGESIPGSGKAVACPRVTSREALAR